MTLDAPTPKHILVRELNWLGDAVMSTSALQRLRQAWPAARITVLSHEKLADLWKEQPFVDDVVVFSKQQSVWTTARSVRGLQCDTGIVFPNSIRSALEMWLAGIPVRIGYVRPWRTLFLSHPVRPRQGSIPMRKRSDREVRRLVSHGLESPVIPIGAHHLHDYIALTATLGALTNPLPPLIHVTEAEMRQAREQFGIGAGGQTCWFGLNPGAEYGPAKRWPTEHFVMAAVMLHKRTGCRWVLFGGPGDRDAATQIASAIERQTGKAIITDLTGKTTLRQLAAALKSCELVITNDTGPMHLASAVGTPVVIPFGSTSPEMTGPLFATNARIIKATAPCSPCFRRVCPIDLRCLTEIEPDAVVAAALELLSGFRKNQSL